MRCAELPGRGSLQTAGALASIAFDKPAPIVDGNVARVLARLLAIDGDLRRPREPGAALERGGGRSRGGDDPARRTRA
jgi:adenine-specific DNA glycosylase